MALDVNTSLASLVSNERTQPSKARASEKDAPRDASATDDASAQQNFLALVSDKAAASVTVATQKATIASRTRGAMPGRIAGHVDAAGINASGISKASADGTQTAGIVMKPAEVIPAKTAHAGTATREGRETPEQAEALGLGADKAADVGRDAAHAEDISGDQMMGEGHDGAHGEGGGESAGQEGEGCPGKAADETKPDVVSGEAGVVQAAPVQVAGVVPGVASGGGEGAGELSGTGVGSVLAKGGAEEILQPGMAQHVEALREAISKGEMSASNGKNGIGGTISAEAKAAKGGEVLGEALPPVAPEGPSLRGGIFSDMLEGFGSTHGLARGHDLLSGLDRPVAAAALAGRAADVQRPTPLQMLPVEIGMQAVRGAREFQIRLDPAELGRVDVKLHINDKGEVNASLVVERPETLQLLRRDSSTLTQAFEQAGLKQGENALSFSLKGESQQGQQQHQHASSGFVQDGEDAALQAQIGEIAMRRVMIPNSSLDLMV